MYMADIHNRYLCYHIYDTETDRDNPHDFGRMLLGNQKCSLTLLATICIFGDNMVGKDCIGFLNIYKL